MLDGSSFGATPSSTVGIAVGVGRSVDDDGSDGITDGRSLLMLDGSSVGATTGSSVGIVDDDDCADGINDGRSLLIMLDGSSFGATTGSSVGIAVGVDRSANDDDSDESKVV
jgi:hypothetical protein